MSQHTHARTPPPLTPFLLPSILFAECDWSCNACKGPLRTDCLQCMEAYVLQEGVCTQGCSFGSYRDGDRCLGQSNKKQINWPTSHAVGAIVAAQRASSGLLHCCLYICVHLKLFFLLLTQPILIKQIISSSWTKRFLKRAFICRSCMNWPNQLHGLVYSTFLLSASLIHSVTHIHTSLSKLINACVH